MMALLRLLVTSNKRFLVDSEQARSMSGIREVKIDMINGFRLLITKDAEIRDRNTPTSKGDERWKEAPPRSS